MDQPQAILRNSALRDLEHAHKDVQPSLMERAGSAAAEFAACLLGSTSKPPLIIAGPGNNGGDAFVVARLLKRRNIGPVVVFAGTADKLPADARAAFDAWLSEGGDVHADIPHGDYALAIDGLLGIGLGKRPLEGRFAELVAFINQLRCPILALDVPSGLDAETGHVARIAVRATHTATFIALKPGLLTLDGPTHAGAVSLYDLGITAPTEDGLTIAPALFSQYLVARPRNSHKGSNGSVGILGGAAGMAGAALLAGRAALKLGAGRVYVGMLERMAVDAGQAELMLRQPEEIFALATCLAVGPGLGQSAPALRLLRHAVDFDQPILLDADAINLLAAHPVLAGKVARRQAPTILTPHPAEAARLLRADVQTVQADRVAAAHTLAQRFNAATVLKGCGSIVALPDGRWFINTSGNPALASAGTGDILAGIAAALLAQGWQAAEALLAAVYLHGAAADACVANGIGPVGLSAGELVAPARSVLNQWIAHHSATHG